MKLKKEEILEACSITYINAVRKCLEGRELALYMFVKGMKFQATGEMPKDSFEELLNKHIKNKDENTNSQEDTPSTPLD